MKNKFLTWVLASISIGVLAVILTGCNTVPITGRSQFNIMSASQEDQLGLTSFDQLKRETPISKDLAANALVQKVGRRIAAVAGKDMPGAQWEFVVFDSKEANAFCLPGGKVGVYTGILPITKDEAGLATVIGHEVGHAVARHGGERMTEATLLQTGSQILGATMANSDPRMQAAASVAYGLTSQVGVALPHSRAQESEADHIGLIYMAEAGYDPRQAVAFCSASLNTTSNKEAIRRHFYGRIRLTPRASSSFKLGCRKHWHNIIRLNNCRSLQEPVPI